MKEIPEKGIPIWYAGGAFIFYASRISNAVIDTATDVY